MRSFLISLACFLVLAAAWFTYDLYSDQKLQEFTSLIEEELLVDVQSGLWPQAEAQFDKLEEDWKQYKKIACYFFSTDELNQIDYSLAKSKYYIKAEDDSNSAGELSCLKEQMSFLHMNEEFSAINIF